ncbi:MAG: sugar transferase [Bacteroidota bacterium]|nr:sugar transferase [Bacteroidota bacterium]
MNDQKRLLNYLLLDVLSAFLAWQLFNMARFFVFRSTIEFHSLSSFLLNAKAIVLSLIIPAFWVLVYHFSGYYVSPRRKTNLGDLLNTAISTLAGVLIVFFVVVVNDYPKTPSLYYEIILAYYGIHFLFCWLFRFMLTGPMIVKQSKGTCNVPAVIIGTGENAAKLLGEFNRFHCSQFYQVMGCVRIDQTGDQLPADMILGNLSDLKIIIHRYRIEELFVAIDGQESAQTHNLLNQLYQYRLPVKAAANPHDILSGKVSLFALFGIPMVNLTPAPMPVWQQKIKQVTDRVAALICLILLLPVYLYLAVRVRKDAPGCIIFTQDRVGKDGKPFTIYKFRTMFQGSEEDVPQLSCKNDPRVTPFGRFMRKYRLDELPQFFNVLKGDMALVGPRPERQFFVDQIIEKAPHYYLTQHVLPGITSWGMVKYGYANTVEKMIRRLDYDILYLENQSLLIDLKILIFTLKPLFGGKGV